MKKTNKQRLTLKEKKEQLSDLSFPTTLAVNARDKLSKSTYVSAYPKKIPAEYYTRGSSHNG